MLRVSYVFALLVASTTIVHADANRDKALKLFEDSDKAYKSGKFEQAAALLRKAYGLFPEPLLLYNLGRAQEGLGDTKGAIASYEQYLKDAKQISDRGAIERRVETLKAQIAKQEDDAKRLLEEQERRKAEAEERKRQQALIVIDDRRPLEKYGPWVTIGTGGALIGTGIIFGIRSGAKHDNAIAADRQRDAYDLQASAERYSTIANVMFVLGGATVVGGVVWKVLVRDNTTTPTGARLNVAPTSVALEWVFP